MGLQRVRHDWATKHSTAYAEHCRWGIPCSFRTSLLSAVSWTRVPSMPWVGSLPSPSLPASQSCSPCFRTPDVGREKGASLAASRMGWEATCHPQALTFPERNCRMRSLLALSWVPLGAGWSCTSCSLSASKLSFGLQRRAETSLLEARTSQRLSGRWVTVSDMQCRRPGFGPWVGKIPWRREWQPTPVFLPEEYHGQRSLLGYSPWGCKESDMTERLSLSLSFSLSLSLSLSLSHTHTHTRRITDSLFI